MLLALAALLVQDPGLPAATLDPALLAAEDARASGPGQLDALVTALRGRDSLVQRQAVRALGRLERAPLVALVAEGLDAPAVTVRIEAANAVAQSAFREGAAPALAALRARFAREPDPRVRAALLAAAGRLPHGADAVPGVGAWLGESLEAADPAVRAGAVRGLYDLLRRQGRGRAANEELVAGLAQAARAEPGAPSRRVAMLALLATGRVDSATTRAALADTDPQVRMLAVQAARVQRELPGRARVADQARRDTSLLVRVEAIRAVATPGIREVLGCGPLVEALADPATAVQLLAIEGLGQGCPPATPPAPLLDAIAREPLTADAWHRPTAALLALAVADSARTAVRLARFATSEVPWARMAAAQVAGRIRDAGLLARLAADSDDNVREAALQALRAVDPAAARRVAVAQLGRGDYQLLLAAARLLQGPGADAAVARSALAAFARVSADSAETSRDTRLALLDVVVATGGAPEGHALRPALADFDPVVAARVASVITGLTGTPVAAAPRPLPPAPLPGPSALAAMRSAVLVMADGGRIELALHSGLAPASVARFVAMARAGWFDGLSFHRVVPNFVIQGGSPRANEYAGSPRFGRDELGRSHRRGTVGISTRGRDTGDGQLFINLVDNLRLDHDYTVIGEVTAGWDVLDRIVAGAVIRRVEIPPA